MIDVINIINLSHRKDRSESIIQQSKDIGFAVRFWEGIATPHAPFIGISESFKKIVRWAKDNRLPYVLVGEDDLKFTHPKAFEYYLQNRPKFHTHYDLYFGMIYEGEIDNNNRLFQGFSGMTLLTVSSRFYDFFLDIRNTNNIDRELGKFAQEKTYLVCPEFVCYQSDGFSDNKKNDATYGHLLKDRKMFGIENQ